MKTIKKAFAMLLAVVMVLGLSVTAFAASDGSITINNAAVGETYSIYKILDLESYDTESGAYSYKSTKEWESWLKTQTDYVSVNDQGYVTFKESGDWSAFAKAALDYAVNNKIEVAGTQEAETETLKFSNLELGYYLISSSKGTICSLITTDPDGVIYEKNEEPSLDKQVEEDSNESWGKTNDTDVGQEVNFKITVTAQPGARNYVIHDNMDAGFTYKDDSVKVTVDGEKLTENEDYTLDLGATDCKFEVKLSKSYLDTITEATEIVIEFTTILNTSADCTICGNTNKSWLSYGDGSKTPESGTTTYTWYFDILKYGDGDETKRLAGAQFVLLNSDESAYAIIEDGVVIGWDYISGAFVAKDGEWSDESILTTDENGSITISGLDGDTYYLREIAAPDGYNKLDNDTEINITSKADSDGQSMTFEPITAAIENNSGSEMPSTGGIGTTIFYVVGSILVIGAAVLLIVKKRMSGSAE